MVKGETGNLSLDVKTSVDKGVSNFVLQESVGVKGDLVTIISVISPFCPVYLFSIEQLPFCAHCGVYEACFSYREE